MATDINRLHSVHEIYASARQVGKTFYMCHSVVGQLEVLPNGSTIVMLVPLYDRARYIVRLLTDILEERGYEVVGFDQASKRLVIRGTNTTVKFISGNSETIQLNGFGVDDNQYLLYDYDDHVGQMTIQEFYAQSNREHGTNI